MAPSLCKHCVSGSIHEGEPKGKTIDIEGTRVYVAEPTGEYPKDKALLFLTDIFGLDLVNNKVGEILLLLPQSVRN